MSKIIDKAFDATQRIIRTLFRGGPNLFTTSDLNRQFEAFKYQLDDTDDKVGCISDLLASAYLVGSSTAKKLRVQLQFETLRSRGVEFAGLISTYMVDSEVIASYPQRFFLCVYADTEVVTHSDDPNISGAQFQDGTTMPAADNIVVSSADFMLVEDEQLQEVKSNHDIVFCVATILVRSTGAVVTEKHFISTDSSAIGRANRALNLAEQASPIGSVIMWAGAINRIPTNYHLCDGAILNKQDYPDLSLAFGQPQTLKLPDLRGRFIVGYDSRNDNEDDYLSDTDYREIGLTGGEKEHSITENELPAHKHEFDNLFFSEQHNSLASSGNADGFYGFNAQTKKLSKNTTGNVAGGSNSGLPGTNGPIDYDNDNLPYKTMDTEAAGSSTPMDMRPPYYVLAYIIRIS